MKEIRAFKDLKDKLSEKGISAPISFEEFLKYTTENPNNVFRNIFQLFHDMIEHYIKTDTDTEEDPEDINYVKYDCNSLFVKGCDKPFFADTPFANRLVNLAKSFREGAQQNKIYIIEGPTGSGKSTFLGNLLSRLEEYTDTDEGFGYEIIWKIDKKKLSNREDWGKRRKEDNIKTREENNDVESYEENSSFSKPLEITCPSHDNPILAIPKQYRKKFIDNLIDDAEFKEKIFTRKEYEWVFKDELCTICSSLYHTLLNELNSPMELFNMIYARKYKFNRRLGEGVSVYNPCDCINKKTLTNEALQKSLNNLLRDGNAVEYVFSNLAKTNNGVFSIMDVKSHNIERLMSLHGIISDSIHKVGHIEERVSSLFLALLNPEDKEEIENVKSMEDRIIHIPMPYVLDYHTEVAIYFDNFGNDISKNFLPGVLENFAKVVIASRIGHESKIIKDWIKNPKKYSKHCDDNLFLLKMELYCGTIPIWLSEEDRKRLDAHTRRKIISESEEDGKDEKSISGRMSIEIFNEFYSKYFKDGTLIDISMVSKFFTDRIKRFETIPKGFIPSLVKLYDYNILQEIKESLYSYSETEISNTIMSYLFAINFEIGTKVECSYTGLNLDITEEFLKSIEIKLDKDNYSEVARKSFRENTQKEYTAKSLTIEMGIEGKKISETTLYNLLMDKYQYNLKEDVLGPFLENDNFRNAIKDFGTPDFKSYDKVITRDVKALIKNLKKKYGYTQEGAKGICIYVIDNKIPERFQ